MSNSVKFRLAGLLALSLSAPAAMSIQQPEFLWQAEPKTDAWVSSSGECWASQCKKTTGLSPCGEKAVPAEITVRLNFKFDKYGLNDIVNDAELARLDEYIAQVKATQSEEAITVVGHTDAKGSDEYNYELGHRRANTMKEYMVSKGIPASDINTASEGKRQMLPEYDIFSVQQRRATIRTTVPTSTN
jgi:OOP family OmpA-OmpF porin